MTQAALLYAAGADGSIALTASHPVDHILVQAITEELLNGKRPLELRRRDAHLAAVEVVNALGKALK